MKDKDNGISTARQMLRASRIAVSMTSLCMVSLMQARAATIAEYDKATQQHRNEFVAVTLQRIENYYLSDIKTRPKAACMQKLYLTKNSSGTPELFTLILNEIDYARKVDADKYKVEDIIFGVIEDACRHSPNADQQ